MRWGFILLVLLPFGGAAQKKMTPDAYLQWYASEAYPFRWVVVKDGIEYALRAVTPECLVARQVLRRELTAEEGKSLLRKNRMIGSYELRITLPSGSDIYSYTGKGSVAPSERSVYWAFDCVHDFSITSTIGEHLACSFALCERGLPGYPVSLISLDFPVDLHKAEKITFLDRALSGEPIDFLLGAPVSRKLPQLIL